MTSQDSSAWADRVAERSPTVQRSRVRSVQQAKGIVDAARRLLITNGDKFTTQELVKEAGVALQTFYRHFGGKDQLLLAVVEEIIAEACTELEAAAAGIDDPIERLHCYVTTALSGVLADDMSAPQFMTAEHWRLHQLFPDEMARANQPFADLVERELCEAAAKGLLHPTDPQHDAWFVMKLVMAVFHHYAFAAGPAPKADIGEQVWQFCLAAFRGGQASEL
ncbi:MAG: TetR/AcrR family transcriptional regulator [Acidimicrobiia bacterium]|nr:TetR/AcrR family transcriptional regulator [Acidimicrobiia bacterium]